MQISSSGKDNKKINLKRGSPSELTGNLDRMNDLEEKIDSLEERVDGLENGDLKDREKINEIIDYVNELKKEIDDKQISNNTLKEMNDMIEKKLRVHKKNNDEILEYINKQQQEIDLILSNMGKMKKSVSYTDELIEGLQSGISSVFGEINNIREKKTISENEKIKIKNEINGLRVDCKKLNKENEEVKAKNESLVSEVEILKDIVDEATEGWIQEADKRKAAEEEAKKEKEFGDRFRNGYKNGSRGLSISKDHLREIIDLAVKGKDAPAISKEFKLKISEKVIKRILNLDYEGSKPYEQIIEASNYLLKVNQNQKYLERLTRFKMAAVKRLEERKGAEV